MNKPEANRVPGSSYLPLSTARMQEFDKPFSRLLGENHGVDNVCWFIAQLGALEFPAFAVPDAWPIARGKRHEICMKSDSWKEASARRLGD